MNGVFRVLAPVALALIPTVTLAGPAERAAAIAPFIESETIAIAYVDLGRLDAPAALKALGEAIPNRLVKRHLEESAAAVAGPAQVLKKAGAELYVVVNANDVPMPGPYFITTVRPDADKAAVMAALAETGVVAHREIRGAIVSGSEATVRRIRETVPAPRPAFAEAFAAAGDAPIQLVMSASTDQRRVLGEMIPRFPEALGGGSGRPIAAIEWLSVQVQVQPQLSLDITVQAATEEAASELKSTLSNLLVALSRMERIRKAVPQADRLATSITPKARGRRLTLRISDDAQNLAPLLAALSVPVGEAQEQAGQAFCSNQLKQLALAMPNHPDQHGRFPAAASVDAKGERLLSWRVHILPYIDQRALYEQFHLDEPWDSDHNKRLIAQMPQAYTCRSAGLADDGRTTYVVTTGEHGLFSDNEGPRIRDIQDGTSNTIMIIEVAPENAVIWTKPDDLEVDPKNPMRLLGGPHSAHINVVICDGAALAISEDAAPKVLPAMFTPRGGEVVPQF